MRVFVAGATGVVGRQLVPLLIDAGHEVVGTTRRESGMQHLRAQGVIPLRIDMFDHDGLAQAVAESAPDALIHQLTALSDWNLADNARVRREGTRNLVDAVKKAGVTRVVAQSIAWAYEPGDTPADERMPLDLDAPEPRSVTIGGVQALEDIVSEIEQHVILRYGLFYGPGTSHAPGGRTAQQIRDAQVTANEGVTSFVHVVDAARAAVLALDWPSGTVNIVDDEPAPAHEWMPVLAQAVGGPAPERVAGRAAWERGADNTLARTKLGWQPRYLSWRTGFADQS
ncbi:dTDP-glucose 4,6-dehydratase [Longimycelium tulufanense]|uniref:dTDP-glucose 4,6-dehydratase n=1 Tax=Longimycelium tulufanense TaxID=907463 RepID=A0A8J3CKB0_9PSEU|nr:NAD(P)-dependent oxidoreductase [Longimycelium tulufanense]GGM80316.1 dTDP-glucose 4,6-dehydratase [Longimycelium tulufanense]